MTVRRRGSWAADDTELTLGGQDAGLDAALEAELTAYNVVACGIDDQRELTLQARAGDGSLLAGCSGWTWGTCAGITLLWVREDQRGRGWGTRMLDAVEREARARGCVQVMVSSMTFQAPGFYERHGYVETGRSEGVPTAGMADVHLAKRLV